MEFNVVLSLDDAISKGEYSLSFRIMNAISWMSLLILLNGKRAWVLPHVQLKQNYYNE